MGLRTIALLEAAKGILALAAVCGVLSLRHTDLHAVTDAFLLRHGIDPERHYTRLFIESVAGATNHHSGQLIAVGIAYGLIRLAEGYGLWRGKHWAEWFAVLSASLWMPLEALHLARRPRLFTAGIILFNIAVIVYLGRLLARQRAERKRRLKADKELPVIMLLILVFSCANVSTAADAGLAVAGERAAASSNLVTRPVAQLSASSEVAPGTVMTQDPGLLASSPSKPVAPATSEARKRRTIMLMVLLVVLVTAGSSLRRRLRSPPDAS